MDQVYSYSFFTNNEGNLQGFCHLGDTNSGTAYRFSFTLPGDTDLTESRLLQAYQDGDLVQLEAIPYLAPMV